MENCRALLRRSLFALPFQDFYLKILSAKPVFSEHMHEELRKELETTKAQIIASIKRQIPQENDDWTESRLSWLGDNRPNLRRAIDVDLPPQNISDEFHDLRSHTDSLGLLYKFLSANRFHGLRDVSQLPMDPTLRELREAVGGARKSLESMRLSSDSIDAALFFLSKGSSLFRSIANEKMERSGPTVVHLSFGKLGIMNLTLYVS